MPKTVTDANGKQHVFPDDFTRDDISGAIGVSPDSVDKLMTADSTRVKVTPHFRGKPQKKQRLPYAEDVGGGIGGMLGAPGAALGGMLGRTATRLATDIPAAMETGEGVNPLATIDDIMKAGGRQALMQGAGGLLAKGAGKLGTKAMQAAIAATPEVAQTAIREGIRPTVQGIEKLGARLGEMGARTMNMMRAATAKGVRFDPNAIANGVDVSLMESLESGLPAAADDRAAYQALKSQFLEENLGRTLTPVDLQIMKQKAQALAEPIFKAIKSGQGHTVDAKVAAKARWYGALSRHAREQLEQTVPDFIDEATGQVVKLSDANAETAALAELNKVLNPEVRKLSRGAKLMRSSSGSLARIGAGAGAGLLASDYLPGNKVNNALEGAAAGYLTTPNKLASYSMLLNNPLLAQLLKQAPRAAGASMREQ